MNKIEELSIATIRSMVIDITNKAKSGHPGMAIGGAPILYTLFTKHLNANPNDSHWINRDRFVLSAGHASALLYTLLHLSGYKISLEDLKHFRQIDSLTPGHPEVNFTDGIDATTGPLGQGLAQAVGMALAEQMLSNLYNKDISLIDHYTYVLCGEGCLQEGVSQEAISFAGHQNLNKLILFFDSNNVTLDGELSLSFSEDIVARFKSCHWNVLEVKNGNDIDEINNAIITAKKFKNNPTVICVKTVIGYGACKQGTNKVHGSPIGIEDGERTKKEVYKFDHEDFFVPNEVYQHFADTIKKRGDKIYKQYENNLNKYEKKYPIEFKRFVSSLNNDIKDYLPTSIPKTDINNNISTRVASGKFLNVLSNSITNLYGGSADVASSVMTKLENSISFDAQHRDGHNINFGIREFLMASAQNGMLLHGGIRTYVGSFLVFSDYMKSAIRTSCLSSVPAIYVFSHDSIALGEDGPTHQPIEQVASLRCLPNINVIRPCDEKETYAAWIMALRSINKPTALILSRQNLPTLVNSSLEGLEKGGYIISKEQKKIDFTLIATGSEVSLAIDVQKLLLEDNIDVRVVSLPCWEIFEQQSAEYQNEVFGVDKNKCISIEMLTTFGWAKWADHNIGIDTFGASAPLKDVVEKFGFTATKIAGVIKKI